MQSAWGLIRSPQKNCIGILVRSFVGQCRGRIISCSTSARVVREQQGSVLSTVTIQIAAYRLLGYLRGHTGG